MSTKKSSKPNSLLRRTKKNLSKIAKNIAKNVLRFQPQPTKESSAEMTYEKTYNTANFIPAKSFKYNSPNTTDEVFEKTREKAFRLVMNHPRIKKSLLQKPAELKEIYVKYNDIYPEVVDFIQTETDKHNVEIGPSESNVKRAEKIAIAIASLKPKKSLYSSTRRNKPKYNNSNKASASKSVSKSASKSAPKSAPKSTMEQLMKSIYIKPVEKKVELTTDDIVSMINKAQAELIKQELASIIKSKK